MTAYYNEIDPFAAGWLRELIAQGHIADGVVDERGIESVRPGDITGFKQCHFFAGIGGWSLALRLAGWPDDRPVWTGSCPCQSFSTAGKGLGFADERHLWPAWFHLISQRQPPIIFGEQVEAAIRHGWLDLIQTDLEGLGYAVGAAVLPAACIEAPHGRHRLWFVADNGREGLPGSTEQSTRQEQQTPERGGGVDSLADTLPTGRAITEGGQVTRGGELGHPESNNQQGNGQSGEGDGWQGTVRGPGPWSDLEWLPCRDGKSRPTQPGLFPLANGVPARVGRLRGYGNAIVPQVAAEFVRAYLNA